MTSALTTLIVLFRNFIVSIIRSIIFVFSSNFRLRFVIYSIIPRYIIIIISPSTVVVILRLQFITPLFLNVTQSLYICDYYYAYDSRTNAWFYLKCNGHNEATPSKPPLPTLYQESMARLANLRVASSKLNYGPGRIWFDYDFWLVLLLYVCCCCWLILIVSIRPKKLLDIFLSMRLWVFSPLYETNFGYLCYYYYHYKYNKLAALLLSSNSTYAQLAIWTCTKGAWRVCQIFAVATTPNVGAGYSSRLPALETNSQSKVTIPERTNHKRQRFSKYALNSWL